MRSILFLPLLALPAAARAEEAPICTDRPTKANAVCTVAAGQWQIESSAADWQRLEDGGSETEILLIAPTFVKLGLTARSDVEVGLSPYVRVTVDGGRASGFGDTIVRYKHRLTGDGAKVQIAAIPFVKLPTAHRDIGNGKVEGGLAVPISFALAGPVTMTLGPEVDVLDDGDGTGRHAAIVQIVNLSAPVAPRLTVVGELWGSWNFDPAGSVRQASADVAAAYAVTSKLQLDAGANFGLTRATADIHLYAGASIRL